MEQTGQALMASNRKRKSPEEPVPSRSGEISRTGKQYGSPWEMLPAEMVVSIFSMLLTQDLLACRAVCKRFALVIGESVLLDKAKAFCKQFAQPPDPTLFGKDRYKQALRPWFESFVTAQQRLPDGASGNLQFSDSKRKESERPASSEQNEQGQTILSSQVEQLDRLIKHEEFTKALFFIHAKTLQNAESLYLQGKVSHLFCFEFVNKVCFSPDGRNLLIASGYTVRFLVFDRNGNVIQQYYKSYSRDVKELHFSPNSCSLLISFSNNNIMIMGLDGKDWVQKGEIRQVCYPNPVCFSPDSDSLAAVFRDSVLIMGRDEKGNWVQNSEVPTKDVSAVFFSPNGRSLTILADNAVWNMDRDGKGNWVRNSRRIDIRFHGPRKVSFSPDGGSLAISNIHNDVSIMRRDENGNWVQKIVIPCTNVYRVCFSPNGGSLAILNSGRGSNPDDILIMRSDEKANWVKNFTIPCDRRYSALGFSPDGHNLMLESEVSSPFHHIIGLDGANGRGFKYEPFHCNLLESVAFSPDGGSLAIGCSSTTWVMGLDKGKWVKKACISSDYNEGSVSPSPWAAEAPPWSLFNESIDGRVRAVCFSPDNLRLAIFSEHNDCFKSKYKASQVSIYEIKTGAKVLTDRDNQFLKGVFSS